MPPEPSISPLAERTLELVNIFSPSHEEGPLYDYVAANAALPLAFDNGESLIYAKRTGKPLVLLAGHTDTVPPQGNIPGRLEDGWVFGLGSTDMKGGLAVMIEIAKWAADTELAYDLGLLFFPREEVGPIHNPLPALFDEAPLINEAALVICLEPTDDALQLGCLGNINAQVVFHGRSAHSARPWLGENAIKLALEGLAPILAAEPLDVEVGGLTFREVVSVTEIHGGIAANVIPATVTCTVNYRFAPDKTLDEAEARLRELVGPDAEITHRSAAARVASDSELVTRLRAVGSLELEPKQAWTNVADFSERGLDAVNFGPGATRYAHAVDERIEIAALDRCFETLQAFLSEDGAR
jgi:succinyl-diaminopimelate desuccinylase